MADDAPDDRWKPTRKPGAHRRSGVPMALTPEQQRLAEDLGARALAIRDASDGDLSIREAIDLAVAQLGLEAPQTHPDQSEDRR